MNDKGREFAMSLRYALFSLAAVLLSFAGAKGLSPADAYQCEGAFRSGYECWKGVDGDWKTWTVPLYNDSIKVIEDFVIPQGVNAANWRFKCLRNYSNIEMRVDYWDYAEAQWNTFYQVPVNLDYMTYVVPIPAKALTISPLKIRTHVKSGGSVSGEYYEGMVDWVYPEPGYQCEGIFRSGYECLKAVDGDTMTSAVPDAYGDSVAVIEYHPIPSGASSATWSFRVLRNNPDIKITAYYWDCTSGGWALLYDVPEDPDYRIYTVAIPSSGLSSSPLKTKMKVKNANFPYPLQSGEYFEGVVDWIYPDPSPAYQCEGAFRPGFECSKAVDGDWSTWTVPLYNDSIKVIEDFEIPSGVDSAVWRFKGLKNWPDIEMRVDYWNYSTAQWETFFTPPMSPNYTTYSVPIPPNALSTSPLRIRTHVKSGGSVSGEYYEGAVDWIYPEPHYACEGCFRSGFECRKAVDGDWWSGPDQAGGACPDKYGDSVAVIESYPIPLPPGKWAANWTFKVLRNTTQIEVWAYCWDYTTNQWVPIYEVPQITDDTATFTVPIPAGGLLSSPLKTKMHVRNGSGQSGAYFEGAVDWVYYLCGDANGDVATDISDVVYLIAYIFSGGSAPSPLLAGDANCDSTVDISDVVYLIAYIFSGGQAPCALCS
jgi:hypothetical protein